MRHWAQLALLLTLAGHVTPATARDAPPVVQAITACRTLSDNIARLACYDQKVADFANAEKSGDVIVADKAEVRESRKAVFGLGPLHLPIFGNDDSQMPKQITAQIKSLRDVGYGSWEFLLDNGMRWRQTESDSVDPRVGDGVTIRAAALGSYFLKVGTQHAVRVMRVQ